MTNIVRFNWHFYALAGGAILALLVAAYAAGGNLRVLLLLIALAPAFQIFLSLAVSYFVYDSSDLYSLDFINQLGLTKPESIATIHAGFDETAGSIRSKFPESKLVVLDFYDPEKHTEVSIRRAREAYPPAPEQVAIGTERLPFPDASFDVVLLILAAHEIRDPEERIRFLSEVRRSLEEKGSVLLVEHLRDLPNFLAFSLGFLHFVSRRDWLAATGSAGLRLVDECKITPFVTAFRFLPC